MKIKNLMKSRLAAAVLTLLIAAGALPMTAAGAANTMTLAVGSVTAYVTDAEVKVPIRVTANTGYGSGIVTVEWDKSKLELTNVEYSDVSPDNGSAPVSNTGSYKIAFGNDRRAGDRTDTGVFFTLTFNIPSGAAAGTIPVKIKTADIQDQSIQNMTVTKTDGSVTLKEMSSVTAVTLNKSALTLMEGGSETLTATISPAEAVNWPVTWASGTESVAAVDATGKVTAVSEGTATIVATADGKVAACTVTVKAVYSLKDGKVSSPAGTLLIAAERQSGRQGALRIVPAPAGGWDGVPAETIAKGAGFTLPGAYKLMLVDGSTYRPLCAAWEKTA